jgi:hypothetical protein
VSLLRSPEVPIGQCLKTAECSLTKQYLTMNIRVIRYVGCKSSLQTLILITRRKIEILKIVKGDRRAAGDRFNLYRVFHYLPDPALL